MADYTSNEDENFFSAIGRLTIAWAHLEFGLDCIVEIIHHGFWSKKTQPELPRALQRKISYLRASIKKLPISEEAIQGYLILFDQIQAAAQTRHDIIHGIVINQAEGSGEATMVRVIRSKDGVTKKRFNVTTRDILIAAVEAQKLGGKVLYWANQSHDLIKKLAQHDDINQPS